MSPRPDVSAARKEQIINAATQVFARSGYEKARMDDIAQETGVSKGTLYWYFKSKDAILLGILDNLLDRELAAIQILSTQTGSARELLLKAVDLTTADFKKIEPLTPLVFEFFALARRHQVIQKAIKGYFRKYIKVFKAIIQRGIEQGEFRPGNPQDVAISIGAILEGTFLLRVYDSKMVNLEEHINSGVNLLLEGLLANK